MNKKQISGMNEAIKAFHKKRKNNLMLSKAMEEILKMVSNDAGRNANNQIRISHGLQVLVLKEAERRGLFYSMYYK